MDASDPVTGLPRGPGAERTRLWSGTATLPKYEGFLFLVVQCFNYSLFLFNLTKFTACSEWLAPIESFIPIPFFALKSSEGTKCNPCPIISSSLCGCPHFSCPFYVMVNVTNMENTFNYDERIMEKPTSLSHLITSSNIWRGRRESGEERISFPFVVFILPLCWNSMGGNNREEEAKTLRKITRKSPAINAKKER